MALAPRAAWIEEIPGSSRVGSCERCRKLPTCRASGMSDCRFDKHASLVSSKYFCGRRRSVSLEITKRTSSHKFSENKLSWEGKVCLHLWTSSHHKKTSRQTVRVHKHRRWRPTPAAEALVQLIHQSAAFSRPPGQRNRSRFAIRGVFLSRD